VYSITVLYRPFSVAMFFLAIVSNLLPELLGDDAVIVVLVGNWNIY
jgi:hypothetical protein